MESICEGGFRHIYRRNKCVELALYALTDEMHRHSLAHGISAGAANGH